MNKIIRPDRPSDNEDIDALFKAQSVTIPSELDDLILAEARQAVDDSAGNVKVLPGTRYRSWFAAAAAALLAVGIVPMLMQSPESALEPSSLQFDSASTNTEASEQPTAMADAEQDSIQASDSVQIAEQPITESLTAAASIELQTASSRMSQSKSAPISNSEAINISAADESGGAAGDSDDASSLRLEQSLQVESAELSLTQATAVATPAPTSATQRTTQYRQSPETWIKEMQRLESEDLIAKAHIEYDQFRQRYPRFKTDYRPKDIPKD